MERPDLRAAPELRFIEPADLGVADGPMALDVVYSIHPGVRLDPKAIRWETPAADPGVDPQAAFRTLTRNVLAEAFRTAVETAPGSHVRLELLQRSLPSPDPELKQLPPLNAKALVLIDFRPPLLERPDLAGQLLVHLYDISFPRYEDLSLSGPRLLIFEDYSEITRVERPSKLVGALVIAWREILERMRASDRFRRYLALSAKPLDRGDQEWAFLLGLVSRDRIPSAPDSQLHEWIEKEILFPSPHEEVRPSLPAAAPPEPSADALLPGPESATGKPEPGGTEGARSPEPIFTGEGGREGKPPAATGDEKSPPPSPAPGPGEAPPSSSGQSTEGR
jgi:hypothetical protein